MRLSQLARQLETDADKIVKHLAKEGIEVENSPNTKLTDDQIALATKKFEVKKEVVAEKKDDAVIKSAAEKLAELDAAKNEESASQTEDKPQEVVEEPKAEKVAAKKPAKKAAPKKIQLEEEPKVIKAELDKDPTIDDTAEVIKAPKVELEGIKVVGKIDLPEKPVKEEPAVEAEAEEKVEEPAQVEEIVNDGPKVHPSKLAKQKAKEVLEVKPTYLPPTPDEEPKKVQTHTNTTASPKKAKRREDKDYEPLWQKKQTYYATSDSKSEKAPVAQSNGKQAPKPKKKTWIGRFFQWWTTE